jgi:glycine/D-amino acid oxidase-like deaminating enzyme
MSSESTTADVIIIGGGLEGTAAAWRLAQRGMTDVVVLERDTVGSGGTGKSSGVVRCHYGVSSLARMAATALETFENAASIFGTEIGFHQTGYIVGVGEVNAASLRASLASQRKAGVDTSEIDRSDVARLWPGMYLDDFAAFCWEPRGGYGDAYATAQAFSTAARRAGARVRQGCAVTEILVSGDAVTGVRLADGSAVRAPTVVVAAGPWSVALVRPLGIDLPVRVHLEQIVLVDPGTEIGQVPVLSDLVSLQYVRAERSGDILFGNSDLSQFHEADPDHYPNRASNDFLEAAATKLAHRFPGLEAAGISGSYAGCFDVTPDWNPVISATPVSGLIIASGFSGHGFKIAPSVGTLIADLVLNGQSSDPDIPESDFRLSRFAEGDLTLSPYAYVGAAEMR